MAIHTKTSPLELEAEAAAMRLCLEELRVWLKMVYPSKNALALIDRALETRAGRKNFRDIELSRLILRRIREHAGEIRNEDPETFDRYRAHMAAATIYQLADDTLKQILASRERVI